GAPGRKFPSSRTCQRELHRSTHMSSALSLKVNGRPLDVAVGSTVAVAVALAHQVCRTSVVGEPRGPLCGMGVCLECRVTINGRAHSRSCQILCEPAMDVRTNE